MKEWDVSLSKLLQPDLRARIIRCKAQMEWLDFFSTLHLGEHLYCHTNNLCKDPHDTNMAAVSGEHLVNLTKETRTKIPTSDQSFDHFYANVAHRSEGLLDEQTLPRKRRTLARLEVGASAPSYPQIPKLRGSIMRLFILLSGLSISALISIALAPTPRWRLSWLKLLIVMTRQSSIVLWSTIQRRCWYRGTTWAAKYFGSYVKGGEDIMFWRNPVGVAKVSRTKKEANSGSQNYL